MTACHHKRCCGCLRPAEIGAVAYGEDGEERFELCRQHYDLLRWEAARKGVVLITL